MQVLATVNQNGGRIDMVVLLSVLALFVILIACINFMNIATARSEHRSREVGVRKVLGATRKLIIWQFLSEAMLMTFVALLLAVLLTQIALPLFNQFTGNNLVINYWDWKFWSIADRHRFDYRFDCRQLSGLISEPV